jgi:hypothetical protein
VRAHAYALASLEIVKSGEQILPSPVGKALAVSAIVAGSKTAPYRTAEA